MGQFLTAQGGNWRMKLVHSGEGCLVMLLKGSIELTQAPQY